MKYLGTERLPQPTMLWVFVVIEDHVLIDLSSRNVILSKEIQCPLDAGHQAVDLVEGVVDRERRPGRRRHPEPAVQRQRAVVSDAHGDAVVVKNLTDVVSVHAVDDERHRRSAIVHRCGSDDAHAVDAGQAVDRRGDQFAFVRFDRLHAESRRDSVQRRPTR